MDESLGGLNMPTRRELRTLQDRLQESRREFKALRTEMELLKEQVMELRKPVPVTTEAAAAKSAAEEAAPVQKDASKNVIPSYSIHYTKLYERCLTS